MLPEALLFDGRIRQRLASDNGRLAEEIRRRTLADECGHFKRRLSLMTEELHALCEESSRLREQRSREDGQCVPASIYG